MTTASLVHCPARLVPPPRDSTGAPKRTYSYRPRPVVHGARHDDAERHLTVVGTVGGVCAPAARVEADLAVDSVAGSAA